MKLHLLALITVVSIQVCWVQAASNATSAADCSCEKIKITNGDDTNLYVGIWERQKELYNDRPLYKMQNNKYGLFLQFNMENRMWIITKGLDNVTAVAAVMNETLFCPEALGTPGNNWKSYDVYFADLGDIAGGPNEVLDMIVRCVDCTTYAEDCGDCTDDCMRIKVSGIGFPVDGFYERVIGEIRDDRSVYKIVTSVGDFWLYSHAFRWVFSQYYTDPTADTFPDPPTFYIDIQSAGGMCAVPANNQSIIPIFRELNTRCSDCSRVDMNYEECDVCVPCKHVLEGDMKGLYSLKAANDANCLNGCLYEKDGDDYCFKAGGPLVKQGCS